MTRKSLRTKRIFSIILSLAVAMTMMPVSALAAGDAAVQATDNVAEVTVNGNTTPYTDIDAAFAAAQEADSATVKLLADVTISHDDYSGIALKKGNITLNLNGKTLSKSTRDDNVFHAKNAVFWLSPPGASTKDEFLAALQTPVRLTVQDSSADGNGRIVQPNGGPAVIAVLNTILTVNGGTIENASSVDHDDVLNHHMAPNCAVLLTGGGKAVIDGGTLRGMRGVAVTGYITKEEEGLYKDNFGIDGYNNDTYGNELTVTGGNICATTGEALIVYEKAKNIELSGGTFTTQSNTYSIWVADTEAEGEPTIKGDASSLLASGCRYENNGTECVYSEDGKGVKGNAIVAPRPANEYAYIGAGGKLATQANCTEITVSTDDISTQGWYVVKENLTISSLNISGEVNLILCDGATLTVSNYMNVTNGSTLNLYWQSAGSGKLTAAGISVLGTVTAPAGEMKQTTGEGSTTFEKCLTHEWGYTVNEGGTHTATCRLCGKAEAAESHKYDSWAPTDADTHTGKCVCGATKAEKHTLTCTPNADGLTHSGKCSVCGYAAAAESHSFDQTDKYGKKCECGAYLAAEYNGRQYATLTSAIEAAKDGSTVTLRSDVGENITVTDGMNVTIDLNNKSWTHTNENGNQPALTVTGGSVTVKNGTIWTGAMSGAYHPVEINGGHLTVGESMTIQGNKTECKPAIKMTGGELVLSVGTKLVCGMRVPEGKQLKDYLPEGTAFQQTAYDQQDTTGTAGIINGYVQEHVGEFTLTVVTHTTHNMTNGACACGLTCAHENIENGVCTVCKQQMKAKASASGGTEKYYLELQEAFEGVANGGTVTMLTTLKDDDTISFCRDADGKPVEKTVTLMMNGHSLSYEGTSSLNIESGKLIIGDDATISQPAQAPVPAVFVDNDKQGKDRGTLEFKGKATLTGGLLIQNWGKLEGGLKEGTIITSNSTYSVSVERSETYSNVLGLLGDGLAFAKYNKNAENKAGAIVDGSVKQLTEDVIVVAHQHTMSGSRCTACGYTCSHKNADGSSAFENGVCTICKGACAHTDVDDDGVCKICKTRMLVKIENGGTTTYSTDFNSAMKNATNGTKITLLADVSIPNRTGISGDDTTVTLNLNGHTITGGWLDVGGKDTNGTYTNCTLKIIGKGSYEPPMFGGIITVNMKATLDLSEWKGGTISSINISDSSDYEAASREAAVIVGPKAGTIGKLSFGNNQLDKLKKTKLSGGSFNEIWVADFGPVKLGELLADGYAYQNEDGSYVEYGTTLQGASIYNVKVVKCLHPNMKPDENGVATCEYCGKSGKFVASVDGNLYTDMDAAVTDWLANGGTLKLYADYTAATEKATWTIVSGEHSIDLNGHRMSVQGDGAFKPTNNMHLTVTDGTERGQIENILLDGSQRGSFTLESGYVGNLEMTGGAVVTLKGGSVDKLDVQNCSANTNLSIQGGSIGKLNIKDWADGMHVSATGGSLGAYNLPSGKILADVLDHQYYAKGTSLDRQVDTAQNTEKFVIKQAPHDFGSTSKAADVPINGSIPFRVDSPSGDATGYYDVKWYRRTNSGAEHMTQNRVAGVNVGDTLDVFCVITGADSPGGAMKWQVAVKGYTIKVVPAKLSGDTTEIVITK